MARHDKDKGFKEQLKNFFRMSKSQGITRSKSDEYITLTEELEAELRQNSPLSTRLKAVKELTECSRNKGRLETYSVERLWSLLKDLLHLRGDVPKEVRHLVFEFFTSICPNQIEKNGVLRSNFFTFIQSHDVPEDAGPRFKFLKALTDNGRDVSYFDEKIGPFILTGMPNSQNNCNVNTAEFMSFLVNLIKFNQSFLDQDILEGIVQDVCFICCTSEVGEDVLECLSVLSAVICYPSLPSASLSTVLATLCRLVNRDLLCQQCWKIMRDLLGTTFGHSGLLTMCQFMETAGHSEETAVIRGAVFFVGAILWGDKMIRSLKYSPSTVLSSFKVALQRNHPCISYEVMMRTQDLMSNQSDNLQVVCWDLILEIMELVITNSTPSSGIRGDDNFLKISKSVNQCLDTVQRIIDSGGFVGSIDRFYKVVDASIGFRQEYSVDKLLHYKMSHHLQVSRPDWFINLITFAEHHYRQETRAGLKVTALTYIAKVCLMNRDTHEEDLLDKVILPYLKPLDTEIDFEVRRQGVKFLVNFLLESNSKKGHELLHILEKICIRPFELGNGDAVHIFTEKEVGDVFEAVQGLIKIFHTKIYTLPSSIPIMAYKIITKHLTMHYSKPTTLEDCFTIRHKIFECFFKIRANSLFHLGFPKDDNTITYSPYLAVDYREGDESHTSPEISTGSPQPGSTTVSGGSSPQPTSNQHPNPILQPVVTFMSLTAACKIVVSSLKKEKDWKVLEIILKEIPNVMENKALILSKHGNDIDYLANALCQMMQEKNSEYPDCLRHRPAKITKADFQGYFYPILTALVSYHSHLDNSQQQKIVRCLERGLMSPRSAQSCIVALSTCTLEMKDTMHKLLPEVLLALSKITPKVDIAIPVLEFLSTLIHLPRVFASFVSDQYLTIFAIALQYTNPFRFSQYTVSLAHHVIAMWFLKCKLSFRRAFVTCIIKGLQNNVLNPCDEENRRSALDQQNEDSSNRKRSSSLTEQSNKRRENPVTSGSVLGPLVKPTLSNLNPQTKESLLAFHRELTETCVDLMSRYAFSDSSALPIRFPSTNFLLVGGHSQSWLVDNRIITITTSGCSQKELRDNLCDRCYRLCRKPSPVLTNPTNSFVSTEGDTIKTSIEQLNGSDSGSRRRHRSELTSGSSKPETLESSHCTTPDKKSKDDLHLELEHKLLLGGKKLSSSGVNRDDMLPDGDWEAKPKIDHMLCNCWCQGWAEVYVRRPTGNTSWMMRIQNQIGNNSGFDLPIRELSAMFIRNPILEMDQPCSTSTSELSPCYTPPMASNIPSSAFNRLTSAEASLSSDSPSSVFARPSTSSPSTPKNGSSPTQERKPIRIPSSEPYKQLVHRSNSSPEMESWKSPYVNQQHQIQELDEEDSLKSCDVFGSEMSAAAVVASTYKSSHMSKGGTTSPYRGSYEAIPEEVTHKDSTTQVEEMISTREKHVYYSQHSADDTLKEMPPFREKEDLTPLKRDRGNTVSVMSGPHVRNNKLRRIHSAGGADAPSSKFGRKDEIRGGITEPGSIRSGMNPAFVFLQLCHQGFFGRDIRPLLVPSAMESSIKVFDYIPPYETHKIGVVYVGPGESKNEAAILQNTFGSVRYRDFIQGLGNLIKLRNVDPQQTFLGGLSKDGDDGEFAYFWQDDVMQVIFHIATLMPNSMSDPNCDSKKKHIGNDYVAIVYNNTNEDYDICTLKGQFLSACIVIQPLDHGTNRIMVKTKPVLSDHIGKTEPKIVSDMNLPTMARQLALHSNLASEIVQKKRANPYASNWLERLRKIKQIRSRILPESVNRNQDSTEAAKASPCSQTFHVVDFTEFV